MPSPLPNSIIDLIISHLYPPRPPPADVLSTSLIHRRTFLPPSSPADLDAYLSPLPSHSSQPLSTRLLNSYPPNTHEHDIVYAHDGELYISRLDHEGVTVLFEFTDDRGWVFREVRLEENPLEVEWSRDIDLVKVDKTTDAGELSVEDYWGAFTPPVREEDVEKGESDVVDYWARYDDAARSDTELEPEAVPASIPILTPPSAEGLDQGKSNAMGLLMQTFGGLSSMVPPRQQASSLDTKVLSSIADLLKKAWADFAVDCEGEAMLEERALEWFRICKGRNLESGGAGESRTIVVQAKVEVLRELYQVLEGSGDEGFWRLIEEVIRIPEE
ncbi:hypothetical protein P7C73_g989, partial [Tremellales sp. Uapishka_1]